jgi:hypothetical protein
VALERARRAVIRVDRQERMEFPDERISGILLSATPRASATVAFIAPGISQTMHVHTRPDNGDEIIFVYRGAFKIAGDGWPDESYDTDADGPVYLQVPTGVPASIVNVGTSEVAFYTLFVPPFSPGEIEYLE